MAHITLYEVLRIGVTCDLLSLFSARNDTRCASVTFRWWRCRAGYWIAIQCYLIVGRSSPSIMQPRLFVPWKDCYEIDMHLVLLMHWLQVGKCWRTCLNANSRGSARKIYVSQLVRVLLTYLVHESHCASAGSPFEASSVHHENEAQSRLCMKSERSVLPTWWVWRLCNSYWY